MHTCTFSSQLNTLLPRGLVLTISILLASLMVVYLILMSFYVGVLMGYGVWNLDM